MSKSAVGISYASTSMTPLEGLRLREFALAQHRSISQVMRLAIAEYLDAHAEEDDEEDVA